MLLVLVTGVPVGVNCLRNDGMAALGAAAVAGAAFVRVNVLNGAMVTDQGILDGEGARLAAYRNQLAPCRPVILADLLVKHAEPLAPVDPRTAARDLAERSGAGGLILTGARTGEACDLDLVRTVRDAVGSFPVWIGSGVDTVTGPELWRICDGLIVGTALKQGGRVLAPVDEERGVVEADIEGCRHVSQGRSIIEGHPCFQCDRRHHTVQGATVEQMPAQTLRQQGGDRALAGATRSVDGHHRYGAARRGFSHRPRTRPAANPAAANQRRAPPCDCGRL